jgi:predicted negative regulator of RcsB-dependent stress response
MVRRAAALLTMFVVIILAATLLWRVYQHHEAAERYSDEPAVVHLDTLPAGAVKFTPHIR